MTRACLITDGFHLPPDVIKVALRAKGAVVLSHDAPVNCEHNLEQISQISQISASPDHSVP